MSRHPSVSGTVASASWVPVSSFPSSAGCSGCLGLASTPCSRAPHPRLLCGSHPPGPSPALFSETQRRTPSHKSLLPSSLPAVLGAYLPSCASQAAPSSQKFPHPSLPQGSFRTNHSHRLCTQIAPVLHGWADDGWMKWGEGSEHTAGRLAVLRPKVV